MIEQVKGLPNFGGSFRTNNGSLPDGTLKLTRENKPNLLRLHLFGIVISESEFKEIANFKELESLNLLINQTSIPVCKTSVSSLKNLQGELRLYNINVQDDEMEIISQFRSLTSLEIRSGSYSAATR